MMPHSPYKGLVPYDRHDQDKFFGRDHEKELLLGQILSHKVTLLYAASGVGKSSLLGAALIPELEALDKENLDVAYHRSWIAEPACAVKDTVKQTLCRRKKITPDELYQLDDGDLPAFFDRCMDYSSDPIVLILDQFEELFRYQMQQPTFFPFIDQLADVMTDRKLPVTIVLSMREDFLAELSVFRGRVPELLSNGYRLQKLTWRQAQEAIVKPVEQDAFGFRYEEALLNALRRELAEAHEHAVENRAAISPPAFAAIEGAYLQIVCAELWRIERHNPERLIRKATYDAMGGASVIVKRYFEQIMGACTRAERRLASRAFAFLVTERGTKMAYPAGVLAKILRVKPGTLQPVLEKLKGARILRDEARPDGMWYELYHEVFAKIIDEWSNAFQQQRWRRLKAGLVASVMAFLCILGLAGYQSYQIAQHKNRLARNAGTLEIHNTTAATLVLTCIRHYNPGRTCPDGPIPVKGASVDLPGPADYVLAARTADWSVNYPVYIDGVTHQMAVRVVAPPRHLPVDMVYIPAGRFRMGDKDLWDVKGLANERPPHDVEVSGFYMDAYEVTNTQYQACVHAGACTPPRGACYDPLGRDIDGIFQASTQPVVCIDWQQAKTFCAYANKRLPTEAEWEKAAAGPAGALWSFGNTFDATKANTMQSGRGTSAPVGTYPANGYGLYDMSGNVSEWVEDRYDEAFYAKPEASHPNAVSQTDGHGPRVQRGGAWWHGIEGVRTTRRHWDAPDEVSTLVGFRCVKSLDNPPS